MDASKGRVDAPGGGRVDAPAGGSAVAPGASRPAGYDGGLTTGAVARLLGVAPTTLRSWERRYGIGPAEREGGRHRRWTPTDVELLMRMCDFTSTGLPPAEAARAALVARGPASAAAHLAGEADPAPARPSTAPGALPVGRGRTEARGLARAAVRLDARAVENLLARALDRHGLVTAWDEVIMPTLHAVGRRWESSGERYVEVEHLLSWHVSTALRRVAVGPAPARGTAVSLLACAPEENHTLPLEALTAGLVQRGLPVRMFGAALPVEALEEAARRTGPAGIVLWSQGRSTASRPLAQRINSIEWGVRGARTAPAVLLAGPGWAGHQPEGVLRPTSLSEALALLSALAAR
ncbi:MerR family transcriptional regulator [Streptomyces sp. AM 2-1-1]|uniref:MerR family transcriptional regulator n=1 Tax=Streptomyces sp. AM 2-1-1 TaxID=3028709 RepID=UPI0023B8A877|nr:MerR family transcriptional regulator [Streptomyces sp. AM 2-1-1]WEH38466.1 MerR family transcriptional regulator [Streptomyces sp. AM 2-1-1]